MLETSLALCDFTFHTEKKTKQYKHANIQVRMELARLGFKTLDEVVGNADLLQQRPDAISKTSSLDLSFITTHAGPVSSLSSERRTRLAHSNGPVLDDELLEDSELLEAIEDGGSVTREATVVNTDRYAFFVFNLVSVMFCTFFGGKGFCACATHFWGVYVYTHETFWVSSLELAMSRMNIGNTQNTPRRCVDVAAHMEGLVRCMTSHAFCLYH